VKLKKETSKKLVTIGFEILYFGRLRNHGVLRGWWIQIFRLERSATFSSTVKMEVEYSSEGLASANQTAW
jgi:hypothetical protein